MTQDEVDLIYDYLHENYEYKEGQLISIKNRRGSKKGNRLGAFAHQSEKIDERPRLTSCLHVNGKKYYIRLSHLIYLFHKKIKPKYIKYIDGNITNLKIENLENIYRGEFRSQLAIKRSIGSSKTPYNKKTFCTRLLYKGHYIFNINYHNKEIAKDAYNYGNDLLYKYKIDPNKIKIMVLQKYPKQPRSKSGYTGVYKASKNRFLAKIGTEQRIIGYFDTPEEAHQAYLKAKEELGK